MEPATNPVRFLRALKGAPLSVLIAIRIFPGPASLLQLAAVTGYDQHTCARATEALAAMGYLERVHYRGWRLSSEAQQLPLWTPGEIGEVETDAPGQPLLAAGDELKRANLAFQGEPDGAPPQPDEPKRANLAFQPEPPGGLGDDEEEPARPPDEPKRANLAFQDDGDALKRANLAFQPPGGSGGGSLINTNTHVEDSQPPPPACAREPNATRRKARMRSFSPTRRTCSPT